MTMIRRLFSLVWAVAGRSKKIQDVFVDAKVPRSEREAWPLVVRGDEVVAVPGLVEADGVTAERLSSVTSAAAGAGPEGTVLRRTGPKSTVPPAAAGGGGARLRRAGADDGEEGEDVPD
jgi:tRNA(Ile)-lysidine synthetase-like protein